VKKQTSLFLALVVASALAITGCSKAETSDSATSASCAKADLATVASGKLTIATGEPAYYPWILDDAQKPELVLKALLHMQLQSNLVLATTK